ncbi:MAG TPA: metalloregulator ArsR/SmtB family transcription factor [Methylococcus sp.]|nr:metalloregulator ArsR/SmtB family transcription factor [Methylococcus sp.]
MPGHARGALGCRGGPVVKALGALAQATRLMIFRLLVQAGPQGLPAGEIARRLGTPNATLSFHLKELAHAGLVRSRQESRFLYYSANFATMNMLLAFLTENCCQGEPCLPSTIPCLSSDEPMAEESAGGREI